MLSIAILDYGTGNMHSLRVALQSAGARVTVERDVPVAASADAIVLPGVGEFSAASAGLLPQAAQLRTAIRDGLPCLGICLGMQLLFEASEEGAGAGLGILPGRTAKLQAERIPHMGWNDVESVREDPIFDGLDNIVAYYANSYVVLPRDAACVVAYTTYGEVRFPAAVRAGNVWGVQFHPEKSGHAGRSMLANFLAAVRRP